MARGYSGGARLTRRGRAAVDLALMGAFGVAFFIVGYVTATPWGA